MNITIKPGFGSPWDLVETVEQIADGICFVTTASHGGYHVERELHQAMPSLLANSNTYSGCGSPWFEEDVEWSLVVAAFPEKFDARTVFHAYKTLAHYADTSIPHRSTYMARAVAWMHSHSQSAAFRAKAESYNPTVIVLNEVAS